MKKEDFYNTNKDDESDEYTLGTENPNVTFLDVKGAEIIS